MALYSSIRADVASTTGAAQASGEASQSDSPRNALGKDAFLNLLVTQLRYQDPLQPRNDTEFIAQLAQFSALEQMQTLNRTTGIASATRMLGHQVVGPTEEGLEVDGTVTGFRQDDEGYIWLKVETASGSTEVRMDLIQHVAPPANSQDNQAGGDTQTGGDTPTEGDNQA